MLRPASSIITLLISALAAEAGAVDYLRDVKPLLQHKCYACHGALKQQSGLRLDTAASLKRGGESGAAIVSGNPDESLIINVLTGEAGFNMPPANEGSPLTADEVAIIRQWIAAGANSPEDEQPEADPREWWSYRSISRPSPPPVTEEEWCRNPIDRFVAASRESHDLSHAGEASKPVWLRRVYIDLIGLPPTRTELQQFLADDSAAAYETVVDDLLSRPQYGERWGRHWMDIWRYSDWYGSRGINEIRYSQRHVWRWRDWIIASLNEDKGYDQMIREMLAADELAGDDTNVLPATGYLGRNWYKFDRNVWMFETVERTGEAFLGLTLRCCRCHDHKFDPISQEEYYRFRAFFEPHDVRTDPISAFTGTQKDATLGPVLDDGIALVFDKQPDVKTFRFKRGDNRYPDESQPLSPGVPAALGGDTVNVVPIDLPTGAWYPMLRDGVRETLIEKAQADVMAAEQKLAEEEAALVVAQEHLAVAEKVPAQATDEAQPFLHDTFAQSNPDVWETLSGTWAYENGRLIEKAVTGFATIVTKANHPSDFKVHLRYRPLQPGTYRSIGFSFDYQDQGNSQDIYTSTNDTSQSVQAFHRVGGNQAYPSEGIVKTTLKVGEEATLDVSVQGSSLTIDLNGERKLDYVMPIARQDGKFALWVHQGSAEFLELKISPHVESIETLQRRVHDADRSVRLATLDIEVCHAELQSVQARLDAAMAAYYEPEPERAKSLAKLAFVAERQFDIAKAKIEIFKLSQQQTTDAVKQQLVDAEKKLSEFQAALQIPTESYAPLGEQYPKQSTGRRTALANWIASPSNPRTARVAANHLWSRHFGRPIVDTTENFGLNGRKPTHPQLLDWLASELIAHEWQMKPLHRQIVLSSTYRMSSQAPPAPPELAKDPENIFLWRMNSRRMEAEVVRDSLLYLASQLDMAFGGAEIPESDGEKVPRRSLYFRNTPNEKMGMLEIFDVADPNSCYRRKESVVPHQSLAMMNSGLALDHARLLAGQLSGSDEEFVASAFETVLSRSPSDAELVRCRQFLSEHAALLAAKSSPHFAAGGSAKRAPAADAVTRARENFVHVLFLHNDFVTIR
ncbi:MAG: DUF1553 domain-containing protein [Planctomycetota bacterium]|nr:DUF1553 domain-containing protein [Planctomycetota bacterium]